MSQSRNDEKNNDQLALDYHKDGRAGKIEVVATKPCISAEDLSLAYTPGVAAPCLEIQKDPSKVYDYTAKGNLVGVITNGSAVLGLGNIGAAAGKPVMEGKGILFKRFADVDVFDIEIDESTVEGMVETIKRLAPTFGGINLEDIKAPECFEIEKRLVENMDIPVFHDDQHGTAIIASAAFINAIHITKKKMNEVKVVFSGAGAAAMACAKLFYKLGVKKENLIMCDSKGPIYQGRKEGMNKYKEDFVVKTNHRSLAETLIDADAFIGCSAPGVLTKEMVKTMGKDPIIFAMANPTPEIFPAEVFSVRKDAIMATGRSDFPNQVNNVLGFPFIFRGALDVRASKITDEMKMAAVHALADLAREDVPDEVKMAYSNAGDFSYGRDYLIPKPFDTRVLTSVAPAVAKAAIDSGVARIKIEDFHKYATSLKDRLGTSATFLKNMRDRLEYYHLKLDRKIKVVFAEGGNTRVLSAMKAIIQDGKVEPILLGHHDKIKSKMQELNLGELYNQVEIIDPPLHPMFEEFYTEYSNHYQRNGVTINHAEDLMTQRSYFCAMMVKNKIADSFVSGPSLNYSNCLAPAIRIIGTKDGKNGKRKASGIFILTFKDRILFLADCTSQISPNSEELADIAESTAELYIQLMGKKPSIAFLSYSNFGSNSHPEARKVKEAVKIAKKHNPDLNIEGEMQADVAVNNYISKNLFSFSELEKSADILIFPELNSANISYKLLQQLTDADAIGPILTPMKQGVNILQRTASISEVVQMTNLTALLAMIEHFHS